MIASVVFLAPHMGRELREKIFALAIGVLVAGFAQAAFQLPTLRRDGFRYHWVSPRNNETVRRVVRQMIPGTLGVAAFQINVAVSARDSRFWIDPQINASFDYAVRLMELPQGMFGISLATYLLTTLSELAVEKNFSAFRATLSSGLGTLLFLNVIAAVLLIVLAEPIIRLLFQHGEFTAASTARASFALMCLAPGLLAFSTVNVLARAFYSLSDTTTPMKISIFCLVVNLVLSAALLFMFRPGYKQGGLGVANTLSSACNAALLLYALRKKLKTLEMKHLRETLGRLAVAGTAAGIVAFLGARFWEGSLGHSGIALKLGAVFVPAAIAGGIYWAMALVFRIPAAREITALLTDKLRRGDLERS